MLRQVTSKLVASAFQSFLSDKCIRLTSINHTYIALETLSGNLFVSWHCSCWWENTLEVLKRDKEGEPRPFHSTHRVGDYLRDYSFVGHFFVGTLQCRACAMSCFLEVRVSEVSGKGVSKVSYFLRRPSFCPKLNSLSIGAPQLWPLSLVFIAHRCGRPCKERCSAPPQPNELINDSVEHTANASPSPQFML